MMIIVAPPAKCDEIFEVVQFTINRIVCFVMHFHAHDTPSFRSLLTTELAGVLISLSGLLSLLWRYFISSWVYINRFV
jgi:hypothetical protein